MKAQHIPARRLSSARAFCAAPGACRMMQGCGAVALQDVQHDGSFQPPRAERLLLILATNNAAVRSAWCTWRHDADCSAKCSIAKTSLPSAIAVGTEGV